MGEKSSTWGIIAFKSFGRCFQLSSNSFLPGGSEMSETLAQDIVFCVS